MVAARLLTLAALAGCTWISDAERAAVYDRDGDGYQAVEVGGDDCDDSDPDANPGGVEVWYDGVDQDCDGDDADKDGDGFQAVEVGGDDCWDDPVVVPDALEIVGGQGWTPLTAEQVYPGAADTWYDGADANCDGVNDFDKDGDGFATWAWPDHLGVVGGDCGDGAVGDAYFDDEGIETYLDGATPSLEALGVTPADIYPGAAESWYDGVDQDCGQDSDWDADGDGHDNAAEDIKGDCDDTDPAVYPNNSVDDWYDCVDSDCDGNDGDRDGDGYVPGGYAATCDWEAFSLHVGAGDCWDDPTTQPVEQTPLDGSTWTAEQVYPGVEDTWYDGVDSDCGGESDFDADRDGYDTTDVADHDGAYGDDCRDEDPAIHPGQAEDCATEDDDDCSGSTNDADATGCVDRYQDLDGDGWGDDAVAPLCLCVSVDDYTADAAGDCLDSGSLSGAYGAIFAAAVHPDATEVCDALDNDCDGATDDDDPDVSDQRTWYPDDDGDGYGDAAAAAVAACFEPTDHVEDDATDCDDAEAAVNPAAAETSGDGVDGDCDGGEVCYVDADDDGYRPDSFAEVVSVDPDCTDSGEALDSAPDGDCDDGDPDINPTATEITGDGVDGDCDGGEICYLDADDDGHRPDATATTSSVDPDCDDAGEATGDDPDDDCDDTDPAIYPDAPEIVADGKDQDCDGGETCYLDADDDGYRPDNTSTTVSADGDCDDSGEAVAATPTGDCDDADPDRNPGADEITGDGVDGDCNGAEVCYRDDDDDGYRSDDTRSVNSTDSDCDDAYEALADDPIGDCDDADPTRSPGATEIVGDAVDQDCDGGEICYLDADDDGYRPDETSTLVSDDSDCTDSGEARDANPTGDCDDANPDANPGHGESVGDGVDGDCDGGEVCYVDADGDGYRPDALATIVSADGDCDDDGEAVADDPIGDCEDDDLETNPGADEVWYDGVDGDCQSGNDYDADGDGYVHEDYDAYAAGAAQDIDDCDDDDPDRNPGADEVHDNGADENCDGYDPVALTAIAAGDLVITELMIAPAAVDDSTGEWIEVYNRSGLDVDLLDLRVREGGVGHIDILDPLVLPADAWMIFARSGDSAINGGLPTDALLYDYTAAGAALGFRDTSDDVYLSNGDESVIFDSLSYDVDAGWPVTSGASMSLSARAIDADLGDAPTAWCPAVDPYGDGDLGTPGAANPSCE